MVPFLWNKTIISRCLLWYKTPFCSVIYERSDRRLLPVIDCINGSKSKRSRVPHNHLTGTGSTPVSYTHLDVYKRQVYSMFHRTNTRKRRSAPKSLMDPQHLAEGSFPKDEKSVYESSLCKHVQLHCPAIHRKQIDVHFFGLHKMCIRDRHNTLPYIGRTRLV